MNCHTAKTWLLAARRSDRLPSRLIRHLTECPACRKFRARLLRTEDLTSRLLTIPDNPGAQAEIMTRLDESPRQPVPEAPPSPVRPFVSGRRPIRRRRSPAILPVAACTAAVLLIGIGWLIGRYGSSPRTPTAQPEPRREVEIAKKKASPEDKIAPVLVRVASLAPRMVGEHNPETRLEILNALADELRAESLRLAGRGQIDDLPRLASMHDRILRAGIAPQVQRIPEGKQRESAIGRLLTKMERIDREVAEQQRKALPSVAAQLTPLAASARAVSRALAAGKAMEPPLGPEPANPTPLDGLVLLSVRLSQEDAPLPRAEASAELGRMLAQATVLLNVAGHEEYSSQMGEYLDAVMAQGVADNLDSVEAEDMKGMLKEKVAQVRERAGEVGAVLERDLEKAPAEAQPGLQKAIEASRHGQERAAKGGKGKGPPWSRKDKIPPGWQKKN